MLHANADKFMTHQQKLTFVMREEKPWSQPLWRTTTDTWAMLTKVTMAISYSIHHCMWKWEMEEETVLSSPQPLNSHILLKSCGSKGSHRDFRLTLVRNMVTCWTTAMSTKDHGKAISFGDKNWSPTGQQSPALASYNWEDRLCSVKPIQRNDAECRQTAKSAMLGSAYHDISKTITQRPSSRH